MKYLMNLEYKTNSSNRIMNRRSSLTDFRFAGIQYGRHLHLLHLQGRLIMGASDALVFLTQASTGEQNAARSCMRAGGIA